MFGPGPGGPGPGFGGPRGPFGPPPPPPGRGGWGCCLMPFVLAIGVIAAIVALIL